MRCCQNQGKCCEAQTLNSVQLNLRSSNVVVQNCFRATMREGEVNLHGPPGGQAACAPSHARRKHAKAATVN